MERAKSSWLLSFGDVVTLLITFFIMMIALNKGEISKLQRWVDDQVTASYEHVQAQMAQTPLQMVQVYRNARGIVLVINQPDAFISGGFEPSAALQSELMALGQVLPTIPLFALNSQAQSREVIEHAKSDGLVMRIEVNVEGHTDNDAIDPRSSLRNNWFLSTLRAQSVMQTLHSASGLPSQLFSVAGYGEHQPIDSNQTVQGKANNRRVEVLITASFQKQDAP